MTNVHLRYTSSRASLLAMITANRDFVLDWIVVAILFSVSMGLSHELPRSDWTHIQVVLVWAATVTLAGMAFATFMLSFVAFVLLPLRAARVLRQNPQIFGTIELDADDVGISLKAPRSVTRYAWGDLRAFKETRKFFVITISKSAAFAVPKDDLTNDSQAAFRLMLEAHVPRMRPAGLTWLRPRPVGT